MNSCTFSWGAEETPTLHNLSLKVKGGSLVAVVGAVGSGKSSLISAFLGEMYKMSGRVDTKVSDTVFVDVCSIYLRYYSLLTHSINYPTTRLLKYFHLCN